MKKPNRFIANIVATAATPQTVLPWTRGARRAAFIVSRDTALISRKSA